MDLSELADSTGGLGLDGVSVRDDETRQICVIWRRFQAQAISSSGQDFQGDISSMQSMVAEVSA